MCFTLPHCLPCASLAHVSITVIVRAQLILSHVQADVQTEATTSSQQQREIPARPRGLFELLAIVPGYLLQIFHCFYSFTHFCYWLRRGREAKPPKLCPGWAAQVPRWRCPLLTPRPARRPNAHLCATKTHAPCQFQSFPSCQCVALHGNCKLPVLSCLVLFVGKTRRKRALAFPTRQPDHSQLCRHIVACFTSVADP